MLTESTPVTRFTKRRQYLMFTNSLWEQDPVCLYLGECIKNQWGYGYGRGMMVKVTRGRVIFSGVEAT